MNPEDQAKRLENLKAGAAGKPPATPPPPATPAASSGGRPLSRDEEIRLLSEKMIDLAVATDATARETQRALAEYKTAMAALPAQIAAACANLIRQELAPVRADEAEARQTIAATRQEGQHAIALINDTAGSIKALFWIILVGVLAGIAALVRSAW